MVAQLTLLWLFFLSALILGIDDTRPLVLCKTTKGQIKIEVYPEWAPLGSRRFLDLVKDNFFTDIALFRCVERFLVQFGISENPSKKHWHRDTIMDDPNLNLGIKKHYVSFAGGGPNTRSTQLFIAFEDLDFLGHEPWETPFGKVIEGQHTLDALYKGYKEMKPFNKKGIDQGKIFNEGNEYVRREFPKIDFIESCEMIEVSDETYLKEKIEQNQLKNLIPFSGDDKVNHVPDEAVILQKEVVKVEEEAKPIEEITIEGPGPSANLRGQNLEEFVVKELMDEKSRTLIIRAIGMLSVFVVLSCAYMYYIKPVGSSASKQL